MTPRQFLKKYSFDERIVAGSYYPSSPLKVERGERVGVVLFNLSGPRKPEDVAPFLYNLFMDPAILDLPVGGIFRHWLCKLVSSKRSPSTVRDYEVIGGRSPVYRLTKEQARALRAFLNKKIGDKLGVSFETYIAFRYWHPFSREVAEKMRQDGVSKVVLLPLFPQYSKSTTGSSLALWWHLEQAGEIPQWPTTSIIEYAANPKYVRAISERIDEALQRFPRDVRKDVHLVFSPHGTPLKEMKERCDPYCCLTHSTVDRIMKLRNFDRPFHIAFRNRTGFGEWLTPSTSEKLHELASLGHNAILIIPITSVTEHIDTVFELDVKVRADVGKWGIDYFEVTSGLNCHPLFIEALAEAVVAQLMLPASEGATHSFEGGTSLGEHYPLRRLDQLPHYRSSKRTTRCHQCQKNAEARRWDSPAQTSDTVSMISSHKVG